MKRKITRGLTVRVISSKILRTDSILMTQNYQTKKTRLNTWNTIKRWRNRLLMSINMGIVWHNQYQGEKKGGRKVKDSTESHLKTCKKRHYKINLETSVRVALKNLTWTFQAAQRQLCYRRPKKFIWHGWETVMLFCAKRRKKLYQ